MQVVPGETKGAEELAELRPAPSWQFYLLAVLVTMPGVFLLFLMWSLDKAKNL